MVVYGFNGWRSYFGRKVALTCAFDPPSSTVVCSERWRTSGIAQHCLFYGSRSIVRPVTRSGYGPRVFQKQPIPFLPINRDVIQERRDLLSFPPASGKKEVIKSRQMF